MELRHLRYFVAVAEELHFNRAAERLMIAQPALSQQIQDLERELGVELFERNRRRVRLTTAGEVFLERVYQLLADSAAAAEAARQASQGELGRLGLGFANLAFYTDLIPALLRQFRHEYPQVALNLQELAAGEQLADLHNDRLDAAFIIPPFEDENLQTLLVLSEPAVAVLPQRHPLAERSEIALAELAQEDWVWYKREYWPQAYEVRRRYFQQAGFEPRIVQEVNQPHILLGLVAAELGVTVQAAPIRNYRRSGVVYVPLRPGDWAVGELYLAWSKDNHNTALQNFLAVAKRLTQS